MNRLPEKNAGLVFVPVPTGDLFDKITILEIKCSKITNERQLENVRRELACLEAVRQDTVRVTDTVASLSSGLKQTNLLLWQVEDDIRAKESLHQFDDGFIALARSVYKLNDERARLKREISLHLGSTILEEKSYHPAEGQEGL